MYPASATASGRTELLVVLLIAATGVLLAGAVALAPWHPTRHGSGPTTEIIRVDSPTQNHPQRLSRR